MEQKKAVFFDIDGTIWDRDRQIPDSTRKAIGMLRENGLYTFLCSGRTRSFIRDPRLLEMGFDGILAGCGTYVEFEGKVLLDETLPPELVGRTLKILKKHRLPVILEGRHYLYAELEEFGEDPYMQKLKSEMGKDLLRISEHDQNWSVNKFSTDLKNGAFQEALDELSEWYDFMVHEGVVAEGLPKGVNKATGIRAACEALGIARENTYAFGDSVNDVDMLRYVAHGIAMGDGMDAAKDAADYVTGGLHEDGIFHGLRRFGLI